MSYCTFCGDRNEAGDRFCDKCGRPVGAPSAAPAPAAVPAVPAAPPRALPDWACYVLTISAVSFFVGSMSQAESKSGVPLLILSSVTTFALLSSLLAVRRGHDGIYAAFAGAVLGPLGLLVYAVLPPPAPR